MTLTQVFPVNIEKFLRAPTLKDGCFWSYQTRLPVMVRITFFIPSTLKKQIWRYWKRKKDMLLKIVKKNTIQKYTRKFCYTRKHLCWSLLVESSPQVFSSKFCDIFKYTVFYRTSPVATSVNQEENHKENL